MLLRSSPYQTYQEYLSTHVRQPQCQNGHQLYFQTMLKYLGLSYLIFIESYCNSLCVSLCQNVSNLVLSAHMYRVWYFESHAAVVLSPITFKSSPSSSTMPAWGLFSAYWCENHTPSSFSVRLKLQNLLPSSPRLHPFCPIILASSHLSSLPFPLISSPCCSYYLPFVYFLPLSSVFVNSSYSVWVFLSPPSDVLPSAHPVFEIDFKIVFEGLFQVNTFNLFLTNEQMYTQFKTSSYLLSVLTYAWTN